MVKKQQVCFMVENSLLLFLTHFCLLFLNLYNIKLGNKSCSLILVYGYFFIISSISDVLY